MSQVDEKKKDKKEAKPDYGTKICQKKKGKKTYKISTPHLLPPKSASALRFMNQPDNPSIKACLFINACNDLFFFFFFLLLLFPPP